LKQDHNCAISINGGPLCGESLTSKDGNFPNSAPLFFENKFYMYELVVEQSDDWTRIRYEYSNKTMDINVDLRKNKS
jgi:hypothetical protein